MRRVLFWFLTSAILAAGVGVAWLGYATWADARDNAAIRSLSGGKDIVPRQGADLRVIYARTLDMALRDRTEEAQGLLHDLAAGSPHLRSLAHYAIGNARMRAGFEKIESMALDDAMPEINLAKMSYREALWAAPSNLDAKVNLELAMRLVRDLPRAELDANEDEDTPPRRLWTDLPGLPRGAP